MHNALKTLIINLDQVKLYFIGIKKEQIPNVIHGFAYNYNETPTPLSQLLGLIVKLKLNLSEFLNLEDQIIIPWKLHTQNNGISLN